MKKTTRIVKPYSGYQETGINVPCLRHFFRCLEISGEIMSDSKGGVIYRPADALPTPGTLTFDSTTKTVYPELASTGIGMFALNSGSWDEVPAGAAILQLAVGDVQNPIGVRITAGGGGVAGFSMNTVGTHFLFHDGVAGINYNEDVIPTTISRTSNVVTINKVGHGLLTGDIVQTVGQTPTDFRGAAAITVTDADNFTYPSTGSNGSANPKGTYTTQAVLDDDQVYMYQTWVPGTTAGIYKCVTTSGAIRIDMNTTGALTLPFTPTSCRTQGIKLYGWAIFYFSDGALPSDLTAAIEWMAANWRAGDRYIYPGWIGLL